MEIYEIAYMFSRGQNEVIIVDWTNRFFIASDSTRRVQITRDSDTKENILISAYFITLVATVFFAIGFFRIPIWCIILIITSHVIAVIGLMAYKKIKNVLAIFSAVGTILILSASYFVSVYIYNLSFLFLFVYSIIQIPFTRTIFYRKIKVE